MSKFPKSSAKFAKAQSEIIGAVLVVLVSIGLVGVVYSYGLPLIVKTQDTAKSDRVEAAFSQDNTNSLPSRIEAIANSNKGESTMNLDVDGFWKLDEEEESISFTFFSKISKPATNLGTNPWVALSGVDCNGPLPEGALGVDRLSAICARADSFFDGYNVTYKVVFRPVRSGNTVYSVDLVKDETGFLTSAGKAVRISFEDRKEQTGQQTLITYEIKILFV